MSYSQFGTNSEARRKRVKYTGTSTIYEGMPVCYNYDTTTNILGYDKANSVRGTTTAEGYQNEGKFMEVEDPATANLEFFAGVVAKGAWVGKTGTAWTTSHAGWIEIFIPNGAIVPIRSYISSTVGVNALAIMNGQIYTGNPNAGMTNGAARYVAVAMETVDRSSTAGLCLAKLCPNEFLYSSLGSTKQKFATAGTVDVAAHFINVVSAQNSGGFTGFWVRSEVATAGNLDTAIAIYGEANVTGVCAANYCIANRFSLNLWGGTQTATKIVALAAEIYEQDANLTGSSVIAPLWLRTQIDATNPPAANSHWMINCTVDGADKPDGLLIADTADAIKFEAVSSGTTASHHIPIRVAGTTYYILVEDTA